MSGRIQGSLDPGKHGMIYLHIPNRKPTEQDIKELHRGIARAILMDEKFKAQQA